MKRKSVLIGLLISVVFLSGLYAEGKKDEKYPSRTIRIVFPWSPDGVAYVMTEGMKPYLSTGLGVPVVIDSKPGGGTAVGMKELQIQPPDGYTVGINSTSLIGATYMTKGDVDYKNFDLIASFTEDFYAISVNVDSPWKTLPDLITYMKANPGKVRIGNSGVGTAWHVASIVFAQDMGVEITPVPFSAGGTACDLMSSVELSKA